ncbi:glutamate racemase [Parapedobacter sp. 10938]|uniref:glutamate racemase n=1 Tax=Parapedobacter flavus TaxID=3110225 RepID=UPI002DBA8458|nr:Asp/Glu/hydantoin racemase [Parapedobacter sp. 10938]MEC3881053.1 Asp/Glu/hydantoin racemase [Parapedobacter sp. 10938]
MKVDPIIAVIASAFTLVSCAGNEEHTDQTRPIDPMVHAILEDTASFYYVDVRDYPTDATLPIGIFDSGTGGLTVMDALVRYDANGNESRIAGSDGLPDFSKEQFIYLADQANMPYGNYYSEDKSDLLVEHVLKDAQFLLSEQYYPEASAVNFVTGKQRVKAIVIACNTATAYAKEDVEALIQKTGLDIPVIGVIDAGARGVLDIFEKDEDGAIGVFATVGTIASKGYERTIMELKDQLGYRGDIQIYNQGGYGMAEAVDREPGFISAVAHEPREDYLGPSLNHGQYPIEKALMDTYRFDFSDNKMLCDSRSSDDCNVLQINSTDNYVRYHLVSLLEQLRNTPGARPLKALVLGCTHYPYLTDELHRTLDELYAYQHNGEYVYRRLMAPQIQLIDPAENVAVELHNHLAENARFNPSGSMDSSEFYIAVPNTHNNHVQTDGKGHFTYAYKYGRNVGEIQEYVKVVPFSKANIPAETLGRMGDQIPETFELIRIFNNTSDKTATFPATDRIR